MKRNIFGLLMVLLAEPALGQQLPSAGGQLRQLPPPPTPTPLTLQDQRPQPPREIPADVTVGPSFRVNALHVSGVSAFPESVLIGVAGFSPGATLTLGQLRQMAARISDYYADHGYFVAQAYLPPQAVAEGVVTIAVIEGHYDAITLKNRSRVSDGAAERILSGLDRGDIVADAPLERRLLLLSVLPGTRVRSTITPGTQVGTSDLTVDIERGRMVNGSVDADNAGNRYTGYYRLGGSVNLNNPLGIGDVVSVTGLVSDGGLTYVRGSYQAPVGPLTLGVAYARLDYRLGREFAALHAHGSADIASVYASDPLVRTHDRNVYLLAALNFNAYRDDVDATASTSDKHSRTGSLGLSGDARSRRGSSFWSISGTFGDLDIRTPAVRAIDDATARANGSFFKLNLSAGGITAVTRDLSLYFAGRGQLASKNLDISEKMELGGAYGVRAYPEGEAFGDQGYIVTAEARLTVARDLPGDLSVVGFVDNGGVTFNRNRFSLAHNSTNLSGIGGGVTWAQSGNFQIRASYARRLGSTRVVSGPDVSGQFWFQVNKLF